MNKSGTRKAPSGKKSAGPRSTRPEPPGPTPISGIEKAAFWSVPITAAIAVACSGVMMWLAFSPAASPNTTVAAAKPDTAKKKLTQASTGAADSRPKLENTATLPPPNRDKKQETQTAPEQPADNVAEDTSADTIPPKQPPASQAAAPQNNSTVAPPVDYASAELPAPVFHLFCHGGSMQYRGPADLTFEKKGPVADKKHFQGAAMECLAFNGINQAIYLTGVTKAKGTISVTVQVPPNRTCIFLDSADQNLTLRTNKTGLRWRAISKKWSSKIRDTEPDFDARKWHHIVLTWEQGAQAILYVDGEEFDRTTYKNGNPNPPRFDEVLLGRTFASNKKHYEFWIGELQFFDQALSEGKVKSMNAALRQQLPSFFN